MSQEQVSDTPNVGSSVEDGSSVADAASAVAGTEGALEHGDGSAPRGAPVPETARSSRSRMPFVVIGVVALAALLIGGWVLSRRGSTAESQPATAGMYRLPSEPEQRYSADLEDVPDGSRVFTLGTPERLALLIKVPDGSADELRVLNGDGTVQWSYRYGGSAGLFRVGDDFLAVDPQSESGEDFEMALLAGATGDELWSHEVGPVDQVVVDDDQVLVAGPGRVDVFNTATGEKLAGETYNWVSDIDQTLPASGGFVVWKDGEMSVVDANLKPVSEPVPVAEGAKVSYLDDQLLVAHDGLLTRFGPDGEPAASAEFRADWTVGVDDSIWLFGTAGECGAFRFSGDDVEELWTIGACGYRDLARLEDGKLYAVLNENASGGDVLIEAVSGDEVRSSGGSISLFSNGFLDIDQSNAVGYSVRGDDELFSEPIVAGSFLNAIDGGFVVVDFKGETAEKVTVYE